MEKAPTQRIEFIDALRAIAVLGVIAIHTIGWAAASFPKAIGFAILHGSLGVQLFFLISGFAMFLTIHAGKDSKLNLKAFYLRRIFRIAPLYFLLLIIILSMRGFWSGTSGFSGMNILSHFLFIDSFSPYWMIGGIIGVEWTLSIEMTFYAFIPVFQKYIKNRQSALIAFIVSVIGSFVYAKLLLPHSPIPEQDYWTVFVFRGLIFQLPMFMLGFLLYFIIYPEREIAPVKKYNSKLLLCAGALILPILYIFNHSVPLGLLFFGFAYFLYRYPVKLLVNKIFTYIGRISYSMYLLHLLVGGYARALLDYFNLHLSELWYATLLFLITILFTMAVSTLTYYFIEKPGIALGKKLIQKMRK